uniref:Uncharacterized protein n=1 Tax=Arundo donax TaxID=35708 RepID=A0A0A9H7G1_ARUDO
MAVGAQLEAATIAITGGRHNVHVEKCCANLDAVMHRRHPIQCNGSWRFRQQIMGTGIRTCDRSQKEFFYKFYDQMDRPCRID